MEKINSHELVSKLKFCVFDLETTGGNQKHDKIIEVGLVQIENLKITKKLNFLINPEMNIPEFIQKLTHISNKDVQDQPIIDDKVDEILEFMGDRILVAHNTSFDVPFFNSVLTRLNRPTLENKSLCTNLMTKYLLPNILNSNLTYMSKVFGIKLDKAHRALADAEAAAKLLLNYLNIFIYKNITKINHLYYPRNRYELDRIHYKKEHHTSEEILEFLDKNTYNALITLKGNNGVILFSFPIKDGKTNKFITDKILKTTWKTVTIKVFGHLLESVINFNQFFNKFSQDEKTDILNNFNDLSFDKKTHQKEYFNENSELIDFVIIPHLIPEQFIICCNNITNNKNHLIFRFPAHKKRLVQFISNRSVKGQKIKQKNNFLGSSKRRNRATT